MPTEAPNVTVELEPWEVQAAILTLSTIEPRAGDELAGKLKPAGTVTINELQLEGLERLLETGLYGSTLPEVLVRILDAKLQNDLVDELLHQQESNLEELRP